MATLESMVVEETREQEKPIDREKSKADTKKRRRHHDPVCIQAALDSITSKQYSERKAAFVFDIPRSTLQFNRRCQAAMFTPEEETQLAKWVITSVNNGSCRTYNDICLQAKAILELRKVSSKRSNISTPTPSLSWLSEFLVRHPRLTDICLSEPSSSSNCLPAPSLQPKVEQASPPPSPTADILPSSPQPEAEQDPPPPTTIDILPSSPQPEVEQAPPPTTTIDILPSSSQPEAEQAPTPSDFLPSPTADILLSLQQPKAEQAIPPPPTAHQTVQVLPHKTCPLLLRVFCSNERHHALMEFSRGSTPTNELQIYTWKDATLKELTSLVKEVNPDARRKGTFFDFAIVYPDSRSPTFRLREIGTTCAGRKSPDDNITLSQKKFIIGDYLDIAICPPRPGGGGPPMGRNRRPF